MMATISSISMPRAMKQVTLHMVVTGKRRTRVRLWLGSRLLRLARAIIGCGVEIVSMPADGGFRPLDGRPSQ